MTSSETTAYQGLPHYIQRGWRQDPLVVPLLRRVVGLHDLGPELGVLDLLLLRVDRLAALVQHLKHPDQLGADLLGGHILQVGTLGRRVGLGDGMRGV